MKNILLLGGTGFIGLNLGKEFLQNNYNVFFVGRSNLGQNWGELGMLSSPRFYKIPICETEKIISVIENNNIECVINLVSGMLPSSGFTCYSKEMNEVLMPSFRLVEAIADKNILYVLFSSGGTVYGKSNGCAISEEAIRNPVNYYGLVKKIHEEFVEFSGVNKGLDYLIIRPSNPYGKFQDPNKRQGFIAVAMHKTLNGDPIEVWGDGTTVRDYIYIDDLTKSCRLLLEKNIKNCSINIGLGDGYSINQVIQYIFQTTNKKTKVVYSSPRKVDVPHIILDVKTLKSFIDFKPLSIDAGIEHYYKALKCDYGK